MLERVGKPGFSYSTDVIRPKKDSYEKLKDLSTPNLSDAMNRFGAMHYLIKPMSKYNKLIGSAITVKTRPGDNLMVHKAIDIAQPGDIIVVDTGDCCTNAVWGELMTLAAHKKGLAGLVVDGAVRDLKENSKIDFPIFAKYIVPSACDKEGPGEINVNINCGGVAVNPGDIIVGDENGVVVIPQNIIEDVAKNARKKLEYEAKRKEDIKSGVIVSSDIDKILRDKGIPF